MYCDYNALIEDANKLNSLFNSLNSHMSNIETYNKSTYSASNWNTITSDYYMDMFKGMINNFDNLVNKCNNVKNHLDTVIDNYKSLDSTFIPFNGSWS